MPSDMSIDVVQFLKCLAAAPWLPLVALGISLTSLTFSVLGYLRDRPKLKIEARRFGSEQTPGYIEVKAVNAGRRPVYLVRVWGRDKQGHGSGRAFSAEGPGIKLGEHEFKVFRVTHLPRGTDEFPADSMDDDGHIDFASLWIEDSLGKYHRVPDMQRQLADMRLDYKDWCERTGYWKTPSPT